MLNKLISSCFKPKKQIDNQYILIIQKIRSALTKILRNKINEREKKAIRICIKLCLNIENNIKAKKIETESESIDDLMLKDHLNLNQSSRNIRLLFDIMSKYINNW